MNFGPVSLADGLSCLNNSLLKQKTIKKRHFLQENAVRTDTLASAYLTRSKTAAKKPSV